MSQPPRANAAPVRAAGTASVMGAAARHRPLKATDTVSNARPLILAVEPDERTRSQLEVGLAEQGFAVVSVSSAEEAEGYLHPELMLPSMILSEAELLGVDGFTLCGRIRADARTADLPFVLLSRSSDAVHRELAGGAGADQLLAKPLFLNDVVAMAHLMAGRSSTDARYEVDSAAVPLPQVLRSLLSGVRSGRLEFHPGRAWICFREGQVVDAAYGGLRGEDALGRMLLLAHGSYLVTFGPTLARATMTFGVEDLCGSAYPRLQRWEKLLEAGVSLDEVLVLDERALSAALEQPGEVNDLVRLFDGERSVRDVILQTRMDEVIALEAVIRLAGMGVLVPHGGDASARQRGQRIRALHPVLGETERDESAVDGEKRPESLFESTETLDKNLLRQLAAFRIRPVADRVDTVPASPELTTFVRHVEPPQRHVPEQAGLGAHGGEPSAGPSPERAAGHDRPGMLGALLRALGRAPRDASTQAHEERLEVADPSDDLTAARVEEKFFGAGNEKTVVAPERPPDRRRLVLGVIGTVGVAVLAGIAVVIAREIGPVPREELAESPNELAASPAQIARADEVLVEKASASGEPLSAAASVPATSDGKRLAEKVEGSVRSEARIGLARGVRLYEAGRHREAIAVLEDVTRGSPRLASAWVYLGLARFDAHDSAGAETAARRALAIDPKNGRALMLLATIYLEAGRVDEAKAELQRYLELHPNGRFAGEARQLLLRK